MSGWTDGYEEFPWCPREAACSSGSPAKDLCPICAHVFTAMNSMEHAILAEQHRHDDTSTLSRQKVTALELQIEKLEKLTIPDLKIERDGARLESDRFEKERDAALVQVEHLKESLKDAEASRDSAHDAFQVVGLQNDELRKELIESLKHGCVDVTLCTKHTHDKLREFTEKRNCVICKAKPALYSDRCAECYAALVSGEERGR